MGQEPTAEELIEALELPEGDDGPIFNFRDLEDGSELTGTKDEPGRLETQRGPQIALDIKFEFDSARLTTAAIMTLDQLGLAMVSQRLANNVFLVVGHTDAVGTAGYNLRLSEQRAMAVKRYLVTRFGVGDRQLHGSGKGEGEPLDPANPTGAVNRRVEIINVGRLAGLATQ